MTNRLGLVEVSVLAQKQARLHSEIVTILFENRRYIKTIFLDIHGLYEIAHVGLTIIDPSADLVVFSSTPNIEYNLIQQNLWRNDPCFSPSIQNNHELSWWNDHKITSDLEKIKLKNNRSFSRDIGAPKRQTSKINKEMFFQSGSRSFEQKNFRQKTFNLKDNNDFVKMKTSMILNTNIDKDVWEISIDNREIIEAMLFTSRCMSKRRKVQEIGHNNEHAYENEFLTPEEKMMGDFARENKFALDKCVYLNGDQYLYYITSDTNNKKVKSNKIKLLKLVKEKPKIELNLFFVIKIYIYILNASALIKINT